MTVRSPCIKVCVLRDGRCTGCCRTLAEIAAWESMSDDEKRAVLASLSDRARRRTRQSAS